VRDRFQCQYCGRVFARHELTLDHVIPRCLGGENTWQNLVAACKGCNQLKGGQTPDEAGMPLMTTPGPPRYEQLPELWAHGDRKLASIWVPYFLRMQAA
jgi:5-methylcytosine-specific restriction endonuclease McrA